MKPFQPLNATEHLQQFYNSGHDWAQEAIEAIDGADDAYDALTLVDDLRELLSLSDHNDAQFIGDHVEALTIAARDLLALTYQVIKAPSKSQLQTMVALRKLLPPDA